MESGIEFFCGVPDSLLQPITAYLAEHVPAGKHLTAANEGNAVALAAGHHLSTGKIGLVYMQNSGLGNAVNPLLSLTDPLVYKIPLLLLIGWRGEPVVKDEPQHLKQGQLTLPLLDTLGIKYAILPDSEEEALRVLNDAKFYMQEKGEPFALVIRKGTFSSYIHKNDVVESYPLTSEDALEIVLRDVEDEDVVLSTTGKLSREIFEYRAKNGSGHHQDFLNVGSMGHVSQIALSISLNKQNQTVYCFDGDGAAIMHMGALAINAEYGRTNFKHVLFNNGAHESVGGQPTVGYKIDFCKIVDGCGYKLVLRAGNETELKEAFQKLKNASGPAFLEVRIKSGARDNLGRPTKSPLENKAEFMNFLNQTEGA
jgi:phosphonopyruvate decarboxylase